ncbi:MAG: peroxiredoxin-like family protein [Chitinophagales bacterium]
METQQNFKKVKEAKGLKVGEKAPDFSAINQNDSVYQLSKALQKGPVVLIFYRGQWCPICNNHLSKIQKQLPQIYEKGATVVAISPEKSEFLKKTMSKTGAEFTLLYDEGYKISDAFDVTFRPDTISRAIYNTLLRANLKEVHSDDSQRLPIPATYIIGTDGKVVWRHFDPDYKKRAKVKDILNNLP